MYSIVDAMRGEDLEVNNRRQKCWGEVGKNWGGGGWGRSTVVGEG